MSGMDYPSCLSDKQWQLIQKVLPPAKQTGRKRIDRRRIINAMLYVCRTGCQWRFLPKEFSTLEHGLQRISPVEA